MKIVGKTIETGVVPGLDDKYWGIVRGGGGHGEAEVRGFGSLFDAGFIVVLNNPKYCTKPTDVTCTNSPNYGKLSKAKLVLLRKTTVYEVVL